MNEKLLSKLTINIPPIILVEKYMQEIAKWGGGGGGEGEVVYGWRGRGDLLVGWGGGGSMVDGERMRKRERVYG